MICISDMALQDHFSSTLTWCSVRRPEKDKDCSDWIAKGPGYCECSSGRIVQRSDATFPLNPATLVLYSSMKGGMLHCKRSQSHHSNPCRTKCGKRPGFRCQDACRALAEKPSHMQRLPSNITCKPGLRTHHPLSPPPFSTHASAALPKASLAFASPTSMVVTLYTCSPHGACDICYEVARSCKGPALP